jgi:hypothetical protein
VIEQRTEIKIVKNEEHLTFNIKCIRNEVIPKTIKAKVFDYVPLAHKYAREYSLKCLKVRILETRK